MSHRLSRRSLFVPIALVWLLSPRPVAAQGRIQGQWSVTYEREIRSLHSGERRVVEEHARMILTQRGDSIFGYWQAPTVIGQSAPPPLSVRGALHGDAATVRLEPGPDDGAGFFTVLGREIVEFLRTYVHNAPTLIPVVDFSVRGDSLLGTRRGVSADGTVQSSSRPLSAVRAQSGVSRQP